MENYVFNFFIIKIKFIGNISIKWTGIFYQGKNTKPSRAAYLPNPQPTKFNESRNLLTRLALHQSIFSLLA